MVCLCCRFHTLNILKIYFLKRKTSCELYSQKSDGRGWGKRPYSLRMSCYLMWITFEGHRIINQSYVCVPWLFKKKKNKNKFKKKKLFKEFLLHEFVSFTVAQRNALLKVFKTVQYAIVKWKNDPFGI